MSKPVSEFNRHTRSADGLSAWCVACHKEASRAHYERNKSARNAAARVWAAANPEKTLQANRKYHETNKEMRAAQHSEWAKNNRSARRATAAKRKAAKLRATPAWADLVAIRAIYAAAAEIQKASGRRMHVDHIVPLQSPFVCGLHCEANLRIIPGAENESKKNCWWPDMPVQAYAQGKLFESEPVKQVQEALL